MLFACLVGAALLVACTPAAAPAPTAAPAKAASQQPAPALPPTAVARPQQPAAAPGRYSPEQVQQAVKLEQVRGHLVAALAKAQGGNMDVARTHAAHPIQENWPAIEAALKARDPALATRTAQTLVGQLKLLDDKADARQFEASVADTNKVLDEVARVLLPSTADGGLAFQSNVLAVLLDASVDEYAASVDGDRVKVETEYQDAYGFFQRVRALWRGFEDQVKAKAPHEYDEIEEQLDHLKTALPAVAPPARAVPFEQVEAWARKLAKELAEATEFDASIKAASDSSSAGQLQALAKRLDQAMDALKASNLQEAKHQYQEFDEGWEQIEDGIRAKSRDAYRKIEQAMDEVKATLLKAEQPDNARATAALKQLDQTVDDALPGLR